MNKGICWRRLLSATLTHFRRVTYLTTAVVAVLQVSPSYCGASESQDKKTSQLLMLPLSFHRMPRRVFRRGGYEEQAYWVSDDTPPSSITFGQEQLRSSIGIRAYMMQLAPTPTETGITIAYSKSCGTSAASRFAFQRLSSGVLYAHFMSFHLYGKTVELVSHDYAANDQRNANLNVNLNAKLASLCQKPINQ
jgi:hypothetical protein